MKTMSLILRFLKIYKDIFNNIEWKVIKFRILLLAVTFITIIIFFQSLVLSINIPTFHLDGAFQTASGLFRLDLGHAPGRDFYPYLGVGPILLIFPFFKLAGGTLSASVFATKFVTLVLAWMSVSVLWKLIFRPKMALLSLIGGATILICLNLFVNMVGLHNPFSFPLEPGNSLRPIRSALPYIVAITSYFLINNFKIGLKRNILAGLLVGACMLWSNDYAIPTVVVFSVFYLTKFYFNENLTWKKSAATFIVSAIVAYTILISIITFGHALELFKYNYLYVASDQWWYFAPYNLTGRVFVLSQLFYILFNDLNFPLLVLLFVTCIAILARKTEYTFLSLIGLTLLSGGSLATIGGHVGGYFTAFYYWASITTILLVLTSVRLFLAKRVPFELQFLTREVLLLIPVFFFLLYLAILSVVNYKQGISDAKDDLGRYYVPQLGGYIGIEWKDYIDYAVENRQSIVVEDYWGLWSSINRTFPKWPVDASIHALGNVRGVAKKSLSDADLIISTRYQASTEWQPWNFSQNFWFYEDLLLNWEPFFLSPKTVVWRRTENSREHKQVNCVISNSQKGFWIDSEEIGLYKVVLNYESHGAGRYLLMVQNNISYGGGSGGFVSLPITSSTFTIPTLITNDSGTFFNIKIISASNVSLNLKSCSAEKIYFNNENVIQVR